MVIVGDFDVHRAQITFDYVDTDTGELSTGQIRPATRAVLRRWLAQRFTGREEVAFAVEGCTGWRFVAEELLARRGAAASGRAGGHRHRARAEEAGQDRPGRCPADAGAAVCTAAAGVVDPATTGAGGAHAGPAVCGVDGSAARLAAAHPRPAVPSGRAADHGVCSPQTVVPS